MSENESENQSENESGAQESKPAAKKSLVGQLFLGGILLFCMALGVMLIGRSVLQLRLWFIASDLVETQATVVKSSWSHRKIRGPKRGDLGHRWTSVAILDVATNKGAYRWEKQLGVFRNANDAQAVLQPFPPGRQITVYYHPDHPHNPDLMAVTRDVPLVKPILLGLLGVVVAGSLGYAIFRMIRRGLRPRQAEAAEKADDDAAPAEDKA